MLQRFEAIENQQSPPVSKNLSQERRLGAAIASGICEIFAAEEA